MPSETSVLIQQMTTYFQLSQEAWNKLSSQMSEMAETNKILKRGVKNTYKKVNSITNPTPKKVSNTAKTPKKVNKTVKFAGKSKKDSKDCTKTSKSKTVKANNKKNTTSNTVIEIKRSDTDQDREIDENK